jgi:Kef-type K+ transport system membrane component KefB/nucleotide-binding universal stress UspA family protein
LLENPLTRFVIQVVIIVAVSRIIGLFARRLGQPLVIAEVLAGIVLGPSLFGLLCPEAFGQIFPDISSELASHAAISASILNRFSSNQLLFIFSQVGLIFFMFLIGLELDPKLLHGRGRASVIISHSSIIAPFALGSVLAWFLYERVSDPDTKPAFTSFLLFMGVAMSITAFPVLARILSERRLLRTRIGAITIACAAVDDVTAWCILAFVISIAKATGVNAAAMTTAYALGYIAFMLFLVRPFLSMLGVRYSTRTGVNQNLVAGTFILLLLSSLTTELIGIHALFGAFLFGAIMPREGGYAQALAEKLEDFVVVLLLPLFFAYSGLRTQIGLLNTGEAWLFCGLITLVACVGKFGGSSIAARITGLSWREATAIGILMNTRGLMELIVLNIGLDLKVLSPQLFTMMVIMALVTTFITTPLLRLFYSETDMKSELAPGSEPAPATGFGLLLCVSHPSTGPSMAVLAAALTGKKAEPGRVVALRLLPVPERTSTYLAEEATESRRMSPSGESGESGELAVTRSAGGAAEKDGNALISLLERSGELGLKIHALSFVSSDFTDDICQVAAVRKSDLIVLGWHKPLLNQSRLGGTVHDVMSSAKSDVGVLIDRGLKSIQRILLPFGGSFHDQCALRVARRLNREQGAKITILHVAPPNRRNEDPRMGAREKFDSMFSDTVSGGTVGMKVVEHDEPARAALIEAAQGYDLIIVGCGTEWGLEQRTFGLKPEVLIQESVTSLLILHGYEQTPAPAEPVAQRA